MESIFNATVSLVNQTGFVSSSVAKIAKQAGVSPATIYIYYQNKEDLLISTYIQIKKKFSDTILESYDDSLPVKDLFKLMWRNAFTFTLTHPDYFQYTEQFSYSPFGTMVDKKQVEGYFEPLIHLMQRGIEEGVLKNVSIDILSVFIFYPVLILSNPQKCRNFQFNDHDIDKSFELAWDAVRVNTTADMSGEDDD